MGILSYAPVSALESISPVLISENTAQETKCITVEEQLKVLEAEQEILIHMLYKGEEAVAYAFEQTGKQLDIDAVLIVRSIYGSTYEGLMKDGCLVYFLSPVGSNT